MKLSEIQGKNRPLDIVFDDGQTLTIIYLTSKITPVTQDKFLSKLDTKRTGFAASEFLADVLIEWDLEGEDGDVFPLIKEELDSLPLEFLDEVASKIFDDMEAQKKKERTSRGGSLRKG